MKTRLRASALLTAAVLAAICVPAAAADVKPIRIGLVTFLSGPAAGPFGMPLKAAAESLVESINAGKAPAPYATKGFGGAPIELVIIDEAGGTTKQVSEYRNLVQGQNVDIVMGYVSSGDCLAIAPVAEELKKLTVLVDCGSPRIFEDASYHYVFRTGAHGTMDNVGAALYVLDVKPELKNYGGINQNYAWGQDSWNDFEASMKALKPSVQVTTSQMPKFLSGQYGAEISALLGSESDLIHSSFWGGDLEAFLIQATPRDLFQKSTLLLTAGEHVLERMNTQIPDGTIIGARGTHGPFAPDSELNRWMRKTYMDAAKVAPIYGAYKMAQALLAVKTSYEKAQAANGGKTPDQEQVIKAFEGLSFEGPSGKVTMSLGKGHQAVQAIAFGTVKHVGGKITLEKIKTYPAEKVNPPEGVKSLDWIRSGFKAK